MKRKLILEIITSLFILLFFYVALSKILTYDTFKQDLIRTPLIKGFSSIIAVCLPATEFLVAIFLLLHKTRQFGLYCSFILMLLFTLFVGYILAFTQSKNRPCTCGGILREMNWSQHLWFNVAFTFLALIGIILHSKWIDEDFTKRLNGFA
jgi:putative oxidoreductase